jgi:hypothetical protein
MVERASRFYHIAVAVVHKDYIAVRKSWRTHERIILRGGLSSTLKVGAFIALPRIIQIFGRMLIPPPKQWHQKETTAPLTRRARSNLKNVLIYHVKCFPVFEYSIAVYVIHGENATLGEGMLKKETIQEEIFERSVSMQMMFARENWAYYSSRHIQWNELYCLPSFK